MSENESPAANLDWGEGEEKGEGVGGGGATLLEKRGRSNAIEGEEGNNTLFLEPKNMYRYRREGTPFLPLIESTFEYDT